MTSVSNKPVTARPAVARGGIADKCRTSIASNAKIFFDLQSFLRCFAKAAMERAKGIEPSS